ncbi:hypothetical protein [Dictyobacter kobayashii]|uniref:ABC transporter permease n=1 Tax=Dictyobacter kobayashii TaxID=2014872 RepID=A0A402AWR4_9CHLR|nr:hypothetical protein [Dictyobacter kobayashii]GCE23535.1 hypothetical protein KDK_73350 [Dictyobacter kobayashii]
MNSISVIGGTLRYEFSMQIRRRAVWLVLLLMSAFIFILWYAFAGPDLLHGYYSHGPDHPTPVWVAPQPRDAVLYLAQFAAWFFPIGCGLMLADRIARDYTLHVNEILDTFPGPLGARLLGKYIGSTLATLLPALLIYSLGIGYIFSQAPDPQLIPLALEAFLAVLLPGILFAAGFSTALPTFIKVPIYQLLFILYWFWANLMSPRFHIPTLVGTMLNATGP